MGYMIISKQIEQKIKRNTFVQGLTGIGEGKVYASHISQIKKIVNHSGDVTQIKMNLRYSPVWLQKMLLKIINDLKD
jgi:hypothetical protein